MLRRKVTRNGSAAWPMNFRRPISIRRSVFSARGRLRPKIDGQGRPQSMIS
jgi:hypothetical protein